MEQRKAEHKSLASILERAEELKRVMANGGDERKGTGSSLKGMKDLQMQLSRMNQIVPAYDVVLRSGSTEQSNGAGHPNGGSPQRGILKSALQTKPYTPGISSKHYSQGPSMHTRAGAIDYPQTTYADHYNQHSGQHSNLHIPPEFATPIKTSKKKPHSVVPGKGFKVIGVNPNEQQYKAQVQQKYMGILAHGKSRGDAESTSASEGATPMEEKKEDVTLSYNNAGTIALSLKLDSLVPIIHNNNLEEELWWIHSNKLHLKPTKISPVQLKACTRTISSNKTLVLDLDSTLIWSEISPIQRRKNLNSIHRTSLGIEFLVRNQIIDCIQILRQHYEIFLYTASEKAYADQICSQLEKEAKGKLFDRRFTRRNCGGFLYPCKSLGILKGRENKNIVVVDDVPSMWARFLDNLIPIPPFRGINDNYFSTVTDYLITIKDQLDLRVVNKHIFNLATRVAAKKHGASFRPPEFR